MPKQQIHTEFDYIELGNEFSSEFIKDPNLESENISKMISPEIFQALKKEDKNLEIYADDFVAKVSADLTLEELDNKLQAASKMSFIEAPARYTLSRILGEMYSTREKKTILGLELLHLDGSRSRTGGQVIKNVAGYDLRKLYLGSLNTLALIRSAYIRLEKIPLLKMTMTEDFESISEIDLDSWKHLLDFDINQTEGSLHIIKDFAYEGTLPFTLRLEFYGTPELLEIRKQRVLEKTSLDMNVLMSPFKKKYLSEKQFSIEFHLINSQLKPFATELSTLLLKGFPHGVLKMDLDLINSSIKVLLKPLDFDTIRLHSEFARLNEQYRPLIRIRPVTFENRVLEKSLNLSISSDEIELSKQLKAKFDPEERLNPRLL